MSGSQLKVDADSRAIDMTVDRLGGHIFIADVRSGTVQECDLSGRLLGRAPASLGLNFPNRLHYLVCGTLLVADNDNLQLLWLPFPAVGAAKQTSLLASINHNQAQAGRSRGARRGNWRRWHAVVAGGLAGSKWR